MVVEGGDTKQLQRPILLVLLVLCGTSVDVSDAKVTSQPVPGTSIPNVTAWVPAEEYDDKANGTDAIPAEQRSAAGWGGTPSYQFVEQGNISVMYEKFTTLDKSTIHVASFSDSENSLPSTFRLQVVSEVPVSSYRHIVVFSMCPTSLNSSQVAPPPIRLLPLATPQIKAVL